MPVPSTQLVLIGLRGSGKSTAGASVARHLGWSFSDLDDVVARGAGVSSVAALWAEHGEPHFRRLEATELARMLGFPRTVLSLGGGTPTAPGAADLLSTHRAAGRIIICYLHAPPTVLQERLRSTDLSTRPSLTGSGVLDEIEAVYRQRDPLYKSLADHVIDASQCVDEVVRALLDVAKP